MQRFSNLEKFAQPASGACGVSAQIDSGQIVAERSGNHWEKLGAVIDFVEHRLSAAAPQAKGL